MRNATTNRLDGKRGAQLKDYIIMIALSELTNFLRRRYGLFLEKKETQSPGPQLWESRSGFQLPDTYTIS